MIDVAAAVIQNPETGRILICQRSREKQYGRLWEFPGGKMKAGETPEQALARVCEDELNLTLKTLTPLGTEEDGSLRIAFFLCPLSLNEVSQMVDREHDALAWISRDELAKYKLCPADAAILAKTDLNEIFLKK